MKSVDRGRVWLRGSRKAITRTVYQSDAGKLFIKFYNQLIEVRKGTREYVTIEDY